MRQALLVRTQGFQMIDVPVPVPGDDQALIAVRTIGVCGSDIHAFHGKHPFVHAPIVMGHEASGEVVALGKSVKNLRVGDRVVLRPQQVCGRCRPCREGRYNVCETLKVIGCQCTGAYSEYFAADAHLFTKMPEQLSFDEGALVEPLAVGVHAIKRGLAQVEGKNILVIGAGTIGNLLAQAAKAMGADSVMITDISDHKLTLAEEVGIDYPIHVGKSSLEQAIRDAFGEDGPDAVYECSASPRALNQVLDIVGKGTPIVIVGVYAGLPAINIANVQDREYSLIGTLMYVQDDYEDSLRFLADGRIKTAPLISRTFGLEQIQEAYEYIDAGKDGVQKVLIQLAEE